MALNDTIRVLVRHWAVVLLVTILGAVGGYWFALASASYSASSAVNVTGQSVATAEQAQMVTDFITSEMSVYESLSRTPIVLEAAATEAGVDIAPEDLLHATEIESTGQTIQYTVASTTADKASKLADGIAAATAAAINELHQDTQDAPAVVVARPVTQLPAAASLTNSPLRTAILGGILGVVLGCVAAIGVHLLRGKIGSARQLAEATTESVFVQEPQEPTSETAKRIKTILEDSDLRVEPRLIVIAGASRDNAAAPLAGALAGEFAADGVAVTLVGGASSAAVGGVQAKPLGNLSKTTIEDLSSGQDALRVVAAPAIATHADVLRLAKHADQVLVVVSKSEKLKAALRVGDLLKAADAPFSGYVVS